MAENNPETQDPVNREDLLESITELFGSEPGEQTLSGRLYAADGWPTVGVLITKNGHDITDTVITARLRYLETDGTRIHHTVHLSSEPGANVVQSFGSIWGELREVPKWPPFEEYTDIPSVMLNHVILYTALSYHEEIERGFGKLWNLNNPYANS